jgi:hypothetical protein
MNLTLSRIGANDHGVFSVLEDEDGQTLSCCLEHAFAAGSDGFIPKVPRGTYTCVRGVHKLSDLIPFTTFEITGVPNFMGSPVTGILFHVGNYNGDSEGCVLVGHAFQGNPMGSLLNSREAFGQLMSKLDGLDEFQLTVA